MPNEAPVPPRTVTIGPRRLEGFLAVPQDATGLVIFAHGSGSSRFSPRNSYVAEGLEAGGLGTLRFDLLTDAEAADRANVFDIGLLATRLIEAVRWAREDPETARLAIGLFGASTGAAAALVAAAEAPAAIAAVVSRGGRPDLAGAHLPRVRAPTLLIVGGADYGVIELNQDALAMLTCEKQVEIVPGATHLFEEAGALETVVNATRQWFEAHFKSTVSAP